MTGKALIVRAGRLMATAPRSIELFEFRGRQPDIGLNCCKSLDRRAEDPKLCHNSM
jgi:hypothetical protein